MIVVAGSANTDLVARVSHHLKPGETLIADDYSVHQGGKGANQAVAAARIGTPVRFVGAVGTDDFGEQILASLASENIDTTHIHRHDGSSGLALITVDTAGENQIVVISGANGKLDGTRDLTSPMSGAAALLVQLETPPAFVNAALAAGRAAGAETILNAAPAAPLDSLAMNHVDWLMVNAGEAAWLLGETESTTRTDARRQAGQLVSQHHVDVIVTLGADGVLWIRRNGDDGHIPGRTCHVVDTTGAGDTFAGAFAAMRARGETVEQALRMASTAASLSIGHDGARAGMPDLAAVQAAMGQ